MNIGGVFNGDLEIEGMCIDRMQESADALEKEMFPDTAESTIEDWKRTRGVTVPASSPLEVQQASVVAKERAEGARRKDQFYAIAEALGFNQWVDGGVSAPYIRIVDGEYLSFIVGRSIVGRDILYDGSAQNCRYTISCYGTHVSGTTGTQTEIDRAQQLQTLFNNSHIFGTTFVFIDE